MAGEVTADPIGELARLLATSRKTVVLTGAGISVPSGIPDFRTPGKGVWEKVDPMEVASIDAFCCDTKRFWDFYRPRFESLRDSQPNVAHLALAELEKLGLIDAVITQNIDRLHRKAGSEKLIEIHGSIRSSSCMECDHSWEAEEVETLFGEDGIAICTLCGGKVKPDVVLFGELLNEDDMSEARKLAETAELMLCIGSSLEVYPVAGLPQLALHGGAKLAVMTQGPTPYDAEAAMRINGDVADAMGGVMTALHKLLVAAADSAAAADPSAPV